MATEKDLELLDDYLSNRLEGTDKQAFEQKLEADPNLRQEFEFQQNLVEGVRNKRAAELKAMLNNIPVASVQVSQSAVLTKVVLVLLTVGVVGTGLYFYLVDEPVEEVPLSEQTQPEQNDQPLTETPQQVERDSKSEPEPERIVSESTTQAPKTPATVREKLDATAQRERDLVKVVSKTFVTSSTEVLTTAGNDAFNFHYAFKNKKLVLYGTFEPNQYQILEFITADEHIYFLNYKSSYYLLDALSNTPTPLVPVKDGQLLKRLREFRTLQD